MVLSGWPDNDDVSAEDQEDAVEKAREQLVDMPDEEILESLAGIVFDDVWLVPIEPVNWAKEGF